MNWLYRNIRKVRPAFLGEILKALFRIKRVVVVTASDHKFCIDPVSHFGGEILDTREYEPILGQLIKTLLHRDDIFIDVGANEGYFSVLASSLIGENGRVFSIEPQSRLIPIILENFKLNSCKNSTVFNKGFSDKEGEAILYLTFNTNSGASSFHKHWRSGAGEERIKTSTLDHFFEEQKLERVRLIKLDCEGAELPILNGAQKILSERKVDFISVDFHHSLVEKDVPKKIDRILRTSGYSLTQVNNGIWIYHLPNLEKFLSPLGPLKSIDPFSS